MRIDMLKNGVDSIKKGFSAYLSYSEAVKEKGQPTEEEYYILKQAILSTHHGVEILLKHILNKQSEFLIIDGLNDDFKRGYKEKMEHGLDSVFQTSRSSKIHTITYEEALSRVKYLSSTEITEQLEGKLIDLNKIRNALTHAEVLIDDSVIDGVFDHLLIDLDILFLRAIGTEYTVFFGYSDIKANYDKYMDYLTTNKRFIMKDVVEALSTALEKTQLYSGQEEVIYIDDMKIAKVFLKEFQKKQVFGMDLFNLWCSGEARLNIKDDGHVSIWADDDKDEAIIKFKSMIVYIPKIESNHSPVVILESDNDVVEPEFEPFVMDEDGVRYLDGICFETEPKKTTYDLQEINRFQCQIDNDPSFVIPKHYGITRFLSQRIIGCFNIQGLPYWDFRKLLEISKRMTGKQLATELTPKSNSGNPK